jgi:hypothetical protein
VNTISRVKATQAAVAVLCATASVAVAQSPDQAKTTQDLTSVIALQGLPCGKVVSATQQGADDYVATCSDGNRYRVYVNADGRVLVEKLN